MKDLVSIIVPSYNSEKFISQTISSVISQTYPYWELLICDDCSTDNTFEIIREYSQKDNRIHSFQTPKNSGSPSLPRNICIENSKGRYLAFLDSDDIWLPNKLEEQCAFLEANGYSFVYSDYEKMSWNGRRSNRIIKAIDVSSYWNILESNYIPCLTVLMRREIVSNIRFKNLPKEDYIFWLEVLRRGFKAYNTGKIHALYRETIHSRSGNKFLMLKQQWYVLRFVESVPKILTIYFLVLYAIKGFLKYIK